MARKKRSRSAKSETKPRSASWRELEFFKFEKGTWWYTFFVLVMLVIIGITLWVRNWLLAGVIAAATLAIVSFAKEKPAERQFRIDASGIQVSNRKYQYEELKSFWVAPTPEGNILYLQLTGKFSQPVMINLGNYDPKRVRQILLAHLPEEIRSELFIDRLNRWLKF